MKNKIINIILILCVLVGIGVLAYPFVSNILHDRKQDEIITEYDKQMENLAEEEKEQMLEAARQYNEDLIGNVVLSDPFDPKALEKINEDYDDLLNYNGDGIMGYVEIPRIDVYEAIYHGTSDEVLAKGIGHLANTSLPVGTASCPATLGFLRQSSFPIWNRWKKEMYFTSMSSERRLLTRRIRSRLWNRLIQVIFISI